MTEARQIAFWKYDTAPFVLSGEVEQTWEDGCVKVRGYSCCFRADSIIKLLPYNKGVKLQKKILKQEVKYRKSMSNATKTLRNFLNKNF